MSETCIQMSATVSSNPCAVLPRASALGASRAGPNPCLQPNSSPRLFVPTNRPFVRSNPSFAAFRWSALTWATIIARVFRDARVVAIF